jgi:MFS superfamily sulfate permease-like transporter
LIINFLNSALVEGGYEDTQLYFEQLTPIVLLSKQAEETDKTIEEVADETDEELINPSTTDENGEGLLDDNIEEEVIQFKMEDFATTLTDNIFMDYENMFCYPTLNDCKEEIEKRIQSKIDIRVFATKLATGVEGNRIQARADVIKEMEGRIVHEMEVIKQQKLKSKLKRFESLIRFVQDTVHSAYNRAWKGQERRTLREHIHITESKGNGGFMQQDKPQFTINPIKMMRGR